jgi:hypothetical protein
MNAISNLVKCIKGEKGRNINYFILILINHNYIDVNKMLIHRNNSEPNILKDPQPWPQRRCKKASPT